MKSKILVGGVGLFIACLLLSYQNFTAVVDNPGSLFKTVYSSESLWPVQNLIDSNALTLYSSNYFPTAINDRGLSVAAWTGSLPGKVPMNRIILMARMKNGKALGFPQNYDIYVGNPAGNAWIFTGNFSTQPSTDGVAIVNLGKTYNTNGVLISPKMLGVDDYNNHYFQLAEISFINIPEVTIPTTFNMAAGQVLPAGKMTIAYQTDGNFVVYENLGAVNQRVVWATMSFTACTSTTCSATISKNTGTLILSKNGSPYWSGNFFNKTAGSSTRSLSSTSGPVSSTAEGGGGR